MCMGGMPTPAIAHILWALLFGFRVRKGWAASIESRDTCNDEIALVQMRPGLVKLGNDRKMQTSGRMLQANRLEKVGGVQSKAIRMPQSKANATYDVETNCLVNTGGSCVIEDCARFRGPTTCHFDRCLCTEGCSTADGSCTNHTYKTVLKDFTMRDFRFGRYLYVDDVLWHVAMSDDNSSELNHFTLMETHDGEFIIYAKANPDFAIAIQRTESSSRRRYSPPTVTYSVTQTNVKGEYGVGFDPSAPNVAITLTEPPGGYNDERRPKAYQFNGAHPVMLQSFAHPRHYIYSPYWGGALDQASVEDDDPGDGGLWIFDPPLPMEYIRGKNKRLDHFKGIRCSFDCHGPESKTFKNIGLALVIGLGVMCAVCSIAGLVMYAKQ